MLNVPFLPPMKMAAVIFDRKWLALKQFKSHLRVDRILAIFAPLPACPICKIIQLTNLRLAHKWQEIKQSVGNKPGGAHELMGLHGGVCIAGICPQSIAVGHTHRPGVWNAIITLSFNPPPPPTPPLPPSVIRGHGTEQPCSSDYWGQCCQQELDFV